MIHIPIVTRENLLNVPLRTLALGRLSSARLAFDTLPDDTKALRVLFSRIDPADDPIAADATVSIDGAHVTATCYCSPFCFPAVSDDLTYSVIATDTEGHPRWLGTGSLRVLPCPANGSATVPEIVPADTYIRNPATGLYHKLTATLDEDGNLTLNLADEGIRK